MESWSNCLVIVHSNNGYGFPLWGGPAYNSTNYVFFVIVCACEWSCRWKSPETVHGMLHHVKLLTIGLYFSLWLQTGKKEHIPLILLIFCLWFFVGFSIWHVAYITFSFFAPSYFTHPQFNSPHLKILFNPMFILFTGYLTHPVHKCFPKCVCV